LFVIGHELLHGHPAVVVLIHVTEELPPLGAPRIFLVALPAAPLLVTPGPGSGTGLGTSLCLCLGLRIGPHALRLLRLTRRAVIAPLSGPLAFPPIAAITGLRMLASVVTAQDPIHVAVQ